MKELPIGTEIKLPFVTLEVEAIESICCDKCFLQKFVKKMGNL